MDGFGDASSLAPGPSPAPTVKPVRGVGNLMKAAEGEQKNMSAPAAEDAALRIGRFSLAVWLVGLLILGGALAFAAPRLLPHLFGAAGDAASPANATAQPAAESDAGARRSPRATRTAGLTGAAVLPAAPGQRGRTKPRCNRTGRAAIRAPEMPPSTTSGRPTTTARSRSSSPAASMSAWRWTTRTIPKWPVHFLYNSADRNEPATALLAPARDEFTLTIDAEGDWQLEVRPVPYAELEGGDGLRLRPGPGAL